MVAPVIPVRASGVRPGKLWERLWYRFWETLNLSFDFNWVNDLNGSGGGNRTLGTHAKILVSATPARRVFEEHIISQPDSRSDRKRLRYPV